MNWKVIKKFFPIIGIGIFIYILIKIDVTKVFEEIKNVNIYLFSIAVILTFLSLITQMLKWFILAKSQGMNIPIMKAFKINIISYFYGFITPAKVGNIVRANYLKEYSGGDSSLGVTNFIIDKILDLLSLVIIVVIFSFSFKNIISKNYFYISLLFFIIFIVCIFIFKDKERSKKILRSIYIYLIPKKIKGVLKNSFYSFYKHLPQKKYFILFLLMNMINWIVIYLSIFFIGLSLGIQISFLKFLVIFPIATLVGYIPITISGIGTREVVLISLMGIFGIESSKVISMSILNILIGGMIPSSIAIFLIMKKSIKKDEKDQLDNPGT